MTVLHLTSSTFYGGPERQMLGLASALAGTCRSVFCSFPEGGRCQEFLNEVQVQGFEGIALEHDTPRLVAAWKELVILLRRLRPNVVCCHGYKADIVGLLAARHCRVPVLAVSRGWTSENRKIRIYEKLDRLALRWMNRVVCVSEGQAVKVRKAGVPADRMLVIRNAIRTGRFALSGGHARARIERFFGTPPRWFVGGAGRLSPEKGFDHFIEAARRIAQDNDSVGFLLFGEGNLRAALDSQVADAGLKGRFHLTGFRSDLDHLLPGLDVLVLPSFTEGLPNVVLEACAAGVPVVATAVGGTPEIVEDGHNGYLVSPGDAASLAERIQRLLGSQALRHDMGRRGRIRVREDFTFEAQAEQYQRLFNQLSAGDKPVEEWSCEPSRLDQEAQQAWICHPSR